MSDINSLVNNNFRVLSYMYDKKDNKNLVKATQEEIANDLGLNRGTISYIFKALKENGYIIHDKTHVGRYYLTDSAIYTVAMFKEANEK